MKPVTKPIIKKSVTKPKIKPKPSPTPTTIRAKQTQLPILTTEVILNALDKDEWLTIKHLIFKLRIKDMLDARLLQVKLKELERPMGRLPLRE